MGGQVKVDTFYHKNWDTGLRHHVWLTGSIKELGQGEKWAKEYALQNHIRMEISPYEIIHRNCLLDKVKRPDAWRVILMADKPINALLLKLTLPSVS